MKPLEQKQIDEFLATHPTWSHDNDTLKAEFKFPDFDASWEFLNHVADMMKKHDHHAEIWNVYNTVRLTFTTHDAGNKVTQKDLDIIGGINVKN